MPASTQVQRNHTIYRGRTEAFMNICEHFDFQLQEHDFFFFIILWKCPLHGNFRISLKKQMKKLQNFYSNFSRTFLELVFLNKPVLTGCIRRRILLPIKLLNMIRNVSFIEISRKVCGCADYGKRKGGDAIISVAAPQGCFNAFFPKSFMELLQVM